MAAMQTLHCWKTWLAPVGSELRVLRVLGPTFLHTNRALGSVHTWRWLRKDETFKIFTIASAHISFERQPFRLAREKHVIFVYMRYNFVRERSTLTVGTFDVCLARPKAVPLILSVRTRLNLWLTALSINYCLCVNIIMACLLFSGFLCCLVWPTALKLGCITNVDMLFPVMGFICLVDEIQFMLIDSCHFEEVYIIAGVVNR